LIHIKFFEVIYLNEIIIKKENNQISKMRKSRNEVAQYLTENYKENRNYIINQLKKIPSIINTLTELNDEELYKIKKYNISSISKDISLSVSE